MAGEATLLNLRAAREVLVVVYALSTSGRSHRALPDRITVVWNQLYPFVRHSK